MLNKYAIDNLGETIIPIDCSSPIDSDNFYKYTCSEGIIFYPYTKAIAQAEVCTVPIMNVYEVSYDNLLKYESKRGYGALGSTQK